MDLMLRDRAEITLPIVVQASRLPARGRQAGRLCHNDEFAKLIPAQAPNAAQPQPGDRGTEPPPTKIASAVSSL